jgi:hypothetical protein
MVNPRIAVAALRHDEPDSRHFLGSGSAWLRYSDASVLTLFARHTKSDFGTAGKAQQQRVYGN